MRSSAHQTRQRIQCLDHRPRRPAGRGSADTVVPDHRHARALRTVLTRGRPGESRSFAGFERNQLFLDELAHFLACLRGDESPLVDVKEGARSLRMALAARESIATGQVVELS